MPFRTLRAPMRTHPRSVIVATDDGHLSAWAAHAVRAAGMTPIVVADAAELFDAMASPHLALVIAEHFDGARVENLLATLRTAACAIPAVILAPLVRRALASKARWLAPLEVLDPIDGAALGMAMRRFAGGYEPAADLREAG